MITAGAADPAGQAAFGQCPELTAVELSDLAQKTRLSGQSSELGVWHFQQCMPCERDSLLYQRTDAQLLKAQPCGRFSVTQHQRKAFFLVSDVPCSMGFISLLRQGHVSSMSCLRTSWQ